MKILTILGARPQFIKAGTVSRAIAERIAIEGEIIKEVIVHTGQHYDENMSDVFFDELKIPKPDYKLDAGGKSHGAMTASMIEKLELIMLVEKPDWVMVYGDTNSTLAGAIAASKLHIKIAHVEAGLRSFNMRMPEEINRILTDRVSNILFCPTLGAVDNLNKEGVVNWGNNTKVVLSGDVMQDGANFYRQFSVKPELIEIDSDFILCTIHRAENTDSLERMDGIFSALREISKTKQVIMPLHPRTKKVLDSNDVDTAGITFTEPVGYLKMVWLIENSDLVITDSGGLQKEAYFFDKPCITLRDETEWVELVDSGANKLVGTDCTKIINAFNFFNGYSFEGDNNLYGQGNTSKIIIDEMLGTLNV
ncbi:UDP-N-acetylglucosamine 2-epimerase (non-hydrolyzing) [Colwellia sp. MB02u-18]|uniref:non-hydrolyzing UDP-N-acetylglucosamine 2-epimerase n=1 Tax=unclassified Colwellia TaxID=196834 RepID=UPI0015F537BC|nr:MULTISPECIES: UDP-N-acetylglucosamine 2-epimerase (non-hydrolyzing) [unclassified Colwellia]MBA6222887.1 UDP-N-acetylglucosamine 2-epimerase (non-hydrolyzing) [Colwellia sp. MB3u-45]MBA6267826.1 UDP-N-acetylglucosamine 2-epimerase (non-hydrolyzing) [Colwellia sp. MB3u-43]MBA6322367.1 UDP-N-acetylglucosamine 2-epimerase (non-hydrolyzing) [Colwellia sp. MB02u-19]MBA6324366.1 UDP-N-acetylglucosamine 2-epimerase (non-hydrolyzing) [Colwellia sp. MB02u-18]MBA6332522.1 UDP-N-acetylglucosamine 2-ep